MVGLPVLILLTDQLLANHLSTFLQVEEAALMLQLHEKRPPPRGPFPWAEGAGWVDMPDKEMQLNHHKHFQ